MNTKAVRIYGVKDLRLEEFELPTMKDDEIEAALSQTAFACLHIRYRIREKSIKNFQMI